MNKINLHITSQLTIKTQWLLYCGILMLGAISTGRASDNLLVKEILIEEAFMQIGQEYKVFFNYDRSIVAGIKVGYVSGKYEKVEDALKSVFAQTKLQYQVFENRYIAVFQNDSKGIESLKKMILHFQEIVERQELADGLSRKTIAPLQTLSLNYLYNKKLELNITGTITNGEGESLIGVNILVKGIEKGTSTDIDGRYELRDVNENATLIVSYIGYQTQEIPVNGRSNINVILITDAQLLDEVVVVGFGTQKKVSMVASVSTVKGEDLRVPTRSLSNSLAGHFPGLISVQRSGEPGYDNAEFWIRGISSFAGKTSPLVLVDGVPRSMNDIEPDEIESFSLLKDASATAIYGSEGANGVVLITSKRGRDQKTTISYRGEVGVLTPLNVPKTASSYDFLRLYNQSLLNDGDPKYIDDNELAKYASGEDPDLYPNADWWGALMRDHTTNTRHTLNFRGGGDRMKFFVSGAYFGESGLYKINNVFNNNAGLKRYNLRSNVDIDVTRTTLLRVDLSGQYLQTNYPRSSTFDMLRWFNQAPPYLVPPIYSDGTLASESDVFVNPYNILMEQGYRKEWRSGIQSRVELDQKLDFITEGLKIKAAISYDLNSIYNMTRSKYPATYYAQGRDENEKLIFKKVTNEIPFRDPFTSSSGDKNIYMEAALNYGRSFDKHETSGMLLYNQKERQLNDDALAYRKQAIVGRVTYAYDNRYLLEGNFGMTGSEQFAKGYRYGFFPAVGMGWNITSEPFFPENLLNIVSQLKLKASIGRTGNDDTGGSRFLYRPTFSPATGYNWGIGSTGPLNDVGSSITEGRFESPFISWEIEMKKNYGIEATLYNGKVDFTVDYFDNKRTSILMQRKVVSGVTGFNQTPWQNFGKVSNKGVDAGLNVHQIYGDWYISVKGNFTFARNKILEYDEIPQPYPWMATTGTRLRSMAGIVADRLFREDDFHITIDPEGNKTYTLRDGIAPFELLPNPKPGDIKYVDQNGDGVVDANFDLVQDYAQPTIPEIMYGFGVNANYKGAYINLFFQGAGNSSLNLNNERVLFIPFSEGLLRSNVRQEIVDSHWTAENPSQDVLYPRLSLQNVKNTDYELNTWFYRDASFIRLKTVELGYDIPKSVVEKALISRARIYVIGQNVALLRDKVKMFDPELGTSGSGSAYPLTSVWSMGLDITF